MFLNNGSDLHHLTILYSRWSAILQSVAIKSGLELSLVTPALARNGLFLMASSEGCGSLELDAGWFNLVSSLSLYCHKYSTSMISCSSDGTPGFITWSPFIDSSFKLLPLILYWPSLPIWWCVSDVTGSV